MGKNVAHIIMWQSWVQIKHCSIAYFDCMTAFKALQRRTSVTMYLSLRTSLKTTYLCVWIPCRRLPTTWRTSGTIMSCYCSFWGSWLLTTSHSTGTAMEETLTLWKCQRMSLWRRWDGLGGVGGEGWSENNIIIRLNFHRDNESQKISQHEICMVLISALVIAQCTPCILILTSFPGSPRAHTASNGKLSGAWEWGYTTHIISCSV